MHYERAKIPLADALLGGLFCCHGSANHPRLVAVEGGEQAGAGMQGGGEMLKLGADPATEDDGDRGRG